MVLTILNNSLTVFNRDFFLVIFSEDCKPFGKIHLKNKERRKKLLFSAC